MVSLFNQIFPYFALLASENLPTMQLPVHIAEMLVNVICAENDTDSAEIASIKACLITATKERFFRILQ